MKIKEIRYRLSKEKSQGYIIHDVPVYIVYDNKDKQIVATRRLEFIHFKITKYQIKYHDDKISCFNKMVKAGY